MFRRLLPVLVAVGLATTVLPAHAGSKTAKLYFGNTGSSAASGCTLVPALTVVPTGSECSGTIIAAQGTGLIDDPKTYTSGKKTALKVDTKRKLTGTIYVQHIALINTTDNTVPSLPGYFDLTVTIKLNGVTVGTVPVSGPSLPNSALAVPFELPMPKALTNKTVTKVAATVEWNTATGLSSVTYHDPYASFLSIPVK